MVTIQEVRGKKGIKGYNELKRVAKDLGLETGQVKMDALKATIVTELRKRAKKASETPAEVVTEKKAEGKEQLAPLPTFLQAPKKAQADKPESQDKGKKTEDEPKADKPATDESAEDKPKPKKTDKADEGKDKPAEDKADNKKAKNKKKKSWWKKVTKKAKKWWKKSWFNQK